MQLGVILGITIFSCAISCYVFILLSNCKRYNNVLVVACVLYIRQQSVLIATQVTAVS